MITLGMFLLMWMGPAAAADVLFTHKIQSHDWMLGETSALMQVGYTDAAKYMDKETRYQGSLLKRFFGKVKTVRETSEFDLKGNYVSEVDWENRYVYVYPIDQISDPQWYNKRNPLAKEREEFLKDRYEVSPPRISFEFHDEPETVNGYSTRRVDVHLNLETFDKKKNAKSLTQITQSLWLTTEVDGYDLVMKFNKDLSNKTGVDRYRLGLLGDLLSYFPQDLADIETDLSKIDGYAVKSQFRLEGAYVQNYEDKPAKRIDKVLKEETTVLTKVLETAALDSNLFAAPESFARKPIK